MMKVLLIGDSFYLLLMIPNTKINKNLGSKKSSF